MKVQRFLRGVNQHELAAEIGRSQAWLSLVERGLHRPSKGDLDRLGDALGVAPDELGAVGGRKMG